MARYIDADKIKYHELSVCGGHGLNFEYTVAYKHEVDAIPTADVVSMEEYQIMKADLHLENYKKEREAARQQEQKQKENYACCVLYDLLDEKYKEIERLQAQNSDLDILVKDLRFRNKEFQKANEGLAKNIGDLEIECDQLRERIANAKTEVAREIFAEVDNFILIPICGKKYTELKKKYTEGEQ